MLGAHVEAYYLGHLDTVGVKGRLKYGAQRQRKSFKHGMEIK